MNIAELLSDDDGEREDKTPAHILYARAIYPYPLNTGGPQLLPGRSRLCGFWVSPLVPPATRYIVDSTRLVQGASWTHNPAKDVIPEDALLVVISPADAGHIRKAMATWRMAPHPAIVAARIIDDECRQDPTLAGRMGWKVQERRR